MERSKLRALSVAGILVGCWIPIVVLAFIEFIYFFEMTFYGPPPPKQTGEMTAVLLCSYCVLGMLLSLLRPASVWAIGMTLGSVSLNGYLLLIGDMHQPTLALALLCSWMAVVIGRMRPCLNGWRIGPLFADSIEVAEALFQSCQLSSEGTPIF